VTPLQCAVLYARDANGGWLGQPHLGGSKLSETGASSPHLSARQRPGVQVVNHAPATLLTSRPPPSGNGKNGTAETHPAQDTLFGAMRGRQPKLGASLLRENSEGLRARGRADGQRP